MRNVNRRIWLEFWSNWNPIDHVLIRIIHRLGPPMHYCLEASRYKYICSIGSEQFKILRFVHLNAFRFRMLVLSVAIKRFFLCPLSEVKYSIQGWKYCHAPISLPFHFNYCNCSILFRFHSSEMSHCFVHRTRASPSLSLSLSCNCTFPLMHLHQSMWNTSNKTRNNQRNAERTSESPVGILFFFFVFLCRCLELILIKNISSSLHERQTGVSVAKTCSVQMITMK